jgi:dihydroorotate dehydrogenase (fumarate)
MSESGQLATTYLGLKLPHPFVVGASPMTDRVDRARRLEDAGAAALVMRSVFEEQITAAETGRIHHLDPLDARFATVLSYFPEADHYALAPDKYLEQVRQIKDAVHIPVIASLNGTSAESWLTFGRKMVEAGASALELNVYDVVADIGQSSEAIERNVIKIAHELKQIVTVPVAVKLSPYFTALGHVAQRLDQAGLDGLILFNRFYQPDFDIQGLRVTSQVELSTSSELLLRLRWLAVLHGRVRPSLAACGGISDHVDGVKAILAGAHVVQMVSAIVRHGPAYLSVMRDGLAHWMDMHKFGTLDEVRGRLSLASSPDPEAFERANYIRAVSGWGASEPVADDLS